MRRLVVGILLLLLPAVMLWAQQPKPGKPRPRAALPKALPPSDGIFFEDIFKEGVVGTRPDLGQAVAGTPNNSGNTSPPATGNNNPPAAAGGSFAWSKLIAAATIEDEIKASKKVLDAEVTTPAKFKGAGYKVSRRQFSVLAAMFGIIGEYDGEVRWKGDAAAARDLFARSAGNCKVGTDQSYNESKQRKIDLEDLLGGSGLKGREAEAKATWKTVTDRAPLMQRLDAAQHERMEPWIGNKEEFKSHSEELLHEAQIVGALAEVLTKEGMEDGDDIDYKKFCETIKKSSQEIAEAVKANNYDKARAAVGEINKNCNACHEGYRAS